MDPNISARPMKPKLRAVKSGRAGCRGCDLYGKLSLCRGHGPGVPCVPKDFSPLLHFKIVGEVPSTR